MKTLHTILILASAVVAVFLEASFDLPRRLLGAQFDLLSPLMVYASLTGNLVSVVLLAFVGGFGFDSLSANPPGASVLPLLVVGVVIQRCRHLLLSREVYAQWLLGLGASAFTPLAGVLLLVALGRHPWLSWGSLWQWLVVAVAGSWLTPLYFRLFDRLEQTFGHPPVQAQPFRPDREIARKRR